VKRIPKSFALGSHKFEVKRADAATLERMFGRPCYALFYPDQLTIYVQTKDKTIKQSVLLQTFYHELAHAMLWVMGHKDWANEKVVEQFGHLLKQFGDSRA